MQRAVTRAQRVLWQSQRADGSWDCNGQVGPWVTAQAVVALGHLKQLRAKDAAAAAHWLRAQQRPDGSFLLHAFATVGDLGSTACAWAALHVTDAGENTEALSAARRFVASHGGLETVIANLSGGDFAAVYLALAGLLDAKRLPVPSTWPLLFPPVVRFLQTRFHSGVFQMAFELEVLLRRLRGDFGPDGHDRDLRGRLSSRALIEHLTPFQNPDGSWNDSCVLTVLALPALAAAGLTPSDPMLGRALAWLQSQRVEDAEGLRFDGFGTEVWSTAFDARALLATGVSPGDRNLSRALEWLAKAQLTATPMPRVDHRHARGPLVGGWAFQRSNPTMPDCDDTGVALTTLGRALAGPGAGSHPAPLAETVSQSAQRGKAWLLGMQNPDGGWSAFVWGLPGKRPGPTLSRTPRVPLGDPLAMLIAVLNPPASMGDPSTEDVTARVLHGLGQLGCTVAMPELAHAVDFLKTQQCESGAWWGRWVVNYLSATAFVLMGLEAVKADLDAPWVRRAVRWVVSKQNADGGFGEGPGSYRDEREAGMGPSLPPLTGLVLQGLLDAGGVEASVLDRAAAYLVRTQRADGTWPNGTYLHTNIPPDTFYLYPEAARFYPTEALAKYQTARWTPPAAQRPRRWNDALLDRMRQETDEVADGVVASVLEAREGRGVNAVLAPLFRSDEPIPPGLPPEVTRYLTETEALPTWADPAQLLLAQRLFTRAGWQVSMGLFCSSLPQAYAAAHGARVLGQTQAMTRHVRQRVFETAQFLFDVLDEGAFLPHGRGVRAVQKVRLMHAGVRTLIRGRPAPPWEHAAWGAPINQEDLAGTLMTFSVVTLDALRTLHVEVTPAEAEAWVHTWNVVGALLGLHPALVPENVSDADALMDAIRDRQWSRSEEGVVLGRALVEMMQGYLPSPLQGIPVAMIRHLAGDHCADVLSLPAGDWTRLFPHLLGLADEFKLGPGGSLVDRVVARGSFAIMQGLVLAEREGKQARFRIPPALRDTVNGRF